jgi:hypothetical protein
MQPTRYCDIVDVCQFLQRNFAAPITAYGMTGELVTTDDRKLKVVPAPKPSHLFRGQTKEYPTLRPTIYRDHPPQATWQETQTLQLEEESLTMPNPHYSAELEREYYFSCVKTVELIWDVKRLYPNFPGEVDGHALCQHYGLRTHCLDFSHDVWVSGFFASHAYKAGSFEPVENGIGVMYVLDTTMVPPNSLYEIGFQPLPRPFAQKGYLLKVPPEINLLAHSAVWSVYFNHSAAAGAKIGESFQQGHQLVPHDEVSRYVESRLSERWVTAAAVREYVHRVPAHYQETLHGGIERLFAGNVPIL